MSIEIRKVEKEELMGTLFPLFCTIERESNVKMYPGDPIPTDEMILSGLNKTGTDSYRLFAFDNKTIVGFTFLNKQNATHRDYNQNSCIVDIEGYVLPDYRKKGIGSRMLYLAIGNSFVQKNDILRTKTYCLEGESFFVSLFSRLTEKSSLMVLDMMKVDWVMISCWKERQYQMEIKPLPVYKASIDLETVEEILKLSHQTGIQLARLDNNQKKITIQTEFDEWRAALDYWKKSGHIVKCCLLRDNDEKLLGYTMFTVYPDEQEKIWQGTTAVWENKQGNGYGKMLKALTLEWISKEHPQTKNIYTINNDLNNPMVSINKRLGFESKQTYCSFTIELDKALKILNGRV